MDVIVSHVSADFDAVGAMVGASKLFPGARLAASGSINRNVREFINLYLHDVRVLRPRELDLSGIDRLIMADTQEPSRLGRFSQVALSPSVRKVIFDHHPRPPGQLPLPGEVESFIRPYGATSTVVARKLLQHRIPLRPVEATLLALGIYEDTGGLLFAGTTPTDVRTVYDLTRRGADLSIISAFIQRGLGAEQRSLLESLMANLEVASFHGHEVGIATQIVPQYLEDLDLVVGKLRDIQDLRAVFGVVQMGRHTYVVARARVREVDCSAVVRELGGGGHPFAAAAVVHDTPALQVAQRVRDLLTAIVPPQARAADVMSVPVKTIPASTTVETARRAMQDFGFGGLPVMDDERLVGIISRSDLEKAERHGLGHARITGYMTRDPVTVGADATLSRMHALMVENNISRLPVLRDGKLAGIVTSNDLLRHIHKAGPLLADREQSDTRAPRDARALIERSLGAPLSRLAQRIGAIADAQDVRTYLIGGPVRDILLGRRARDMDIVVLGDAPALAQKITASLGGKFAQFDRFRTATINLPPTDDLPSCRVDLATARREVYYQPGRPQVDTKDVKLDLYRRDFTINAMAISLSAATFGQLVDYYGGFRDLVGKQLRVLHNLSFVEDPSRVLRAIRFAARLGFCLEKRTEGFLREAVAQGMLGRLTPQALFLELALLLREPTTLAALRMADSLGVLPALGPSLGPDDAAWVCLDRVDRTLARLAHESLAVQHRAFPYAYHLWLGRAEPIARASIQAIAWPRRYLSWAERVTAETTGLAALMASPLADRRRHVRSRFNPAVAVALAATVPSAEPLLEALRP